MPSSVNRINSNGSLRIHTRATQPRTSSNRTFQEQFRSGLKDSIDLTSSALKQVAKPILGSAALSATFSDAARNLNVGNKLDSLTSASALTSPNLDGDMNSLQDDMVRNNQDMLEQQMRVSQITTSFSTRSYILKAMFDALKTIGSNIR
jgi:hypothetical protein